MGLMGNNICVQVALVVADMEKAIKKCTEIFGEPPVNEVVTDPYEQSKCTYRGNPSDARAKLAFFSLGEQIMLELIEPDENPSTWRECLEKNNGKSCLHHIAFNINDMPVILKKFNDIGVATVQTGDYEGGRYGYIDEIEDLGLTIELLESL